MREKCRDPSACKRRARQDDNPRPNVPFDSPRSSAAAQGRLLRPLLHGRSQNPHFSRTQRARNGAPALWSIETLVPIRRYKGKRDLVAGATSRRRKVEGNRCRTVTRICCRVRPEVHCIPATIERSQNYNGSRRPAESACGKGQCVVALTDRRGKARSTCRRR